MKQKTLLNVFREDRLIDKFDYVRHGQLMYKIFTNQDFIKLLINSQVLNIYYL